LSLEHSPAKQRRPGIGHNGGPPFSVEDQKVLTIKQWCALNGFSVPTGNRILSLRRKGIRVGDNRRWQESNIRT
jgi:hypothetical protein